jgi:hypothetical protein
MKEGERSEGGMKEGEGGRKERGERKEGEEWGE